MIVDFDEMMKWEEMNAESFLAQWMAPFVRSSK